MQKLAAQILERLVRQQLFRRLHIADVQRRAVEEVQVEQRGVVALQRHIIRALIAPVGNSRSRASKLLFQDGARMASVGWIAKHSRRQEIDILLLIARLHPLQL